MNNPLTKGRFSRPAFILLLDPPEQKSYLRCLRIRHAIAVKQLACVKAQLARELKALFTVSALRSPVSKPC